MTEALYRGKRTDNGEWVEGFYHFTNWYDPTTKEIVETTHGILAVGGQDAFQVIPETVGQYVRNDVNGNRAFAGDIIKNDLGDEVGVIRFGEYRNTMNDDGHACHVGFYVEWHGGRAAKCLRKDVGYWLNYHPVAGNVHDNPELLEVTE